MWAGQILYTFPSISIVIFHPFQCPLHDNERNLLPESSDIFSPPLCNIVTCMQEEG